MEYKRIHMDDVSPLMPLPVRLEEQEVTIWPLNEPGHVLITGHIDETERVVVVPDPGAIFCLMKLGFFGLHSNRELQFLHCQTLPDPAKVSQFTLGTYVLKEVSVPEAMAKFDEDMNVEKTVTPAPRKDVPNLVLKLSLEESYFLSYGLGILRIHKTESDKQAEGGFYRLNELWTKFCALKADFVPFYCAFHYFRSKGWIVRNGYKFGSNYLLYNEGPAFNHATYSVLVNKGESSSIKWQELAGLIRVSKNAGKELLVCTVIFEGDSASPRSKDSPECIKDSRIQLFHVSRSVPSTMLPGCS